MINRFSLLIFATIFTLPAITFSDDSDSYRIVKQLQSRDGNGNYVTRSYPIDIIFYRNYQIILQPYFTHTGTTEIKHFPFSTDSEKRVDTGYVSYITKKGTPGLRYDSLTAINGHAKNVDSLIAVESNIPSELRLYMLEHKNKVKTNGRSNNGDFIETITVTDNKNIKDPDSSIFYYQKSPLTFSFKNNSKIFSKKILYKAEFYYRKAQSAGNISHINKATFEITKNNHFRGEFLNALARKFEADPGLKK